MSIDPYFIPVMIGGALAGGSTGMLGAFVVGMRIPFLGICVSHAALAGAIFGSLFGLTGQMLLLPAMASAAATALLLGMLGDEKIHLKTNVVMGVLFSLTMGLAFLGIGLFDRFDRSANEALGLLWGSLTFCGWDEVTLIAIVAAVELIFVLIFHKELRAIMFSREHAAAAGVHVTFIWTGFLIITSVVTTVNFQTVGGLMIYSLMTNPAAAAFQLTTGYWRVLILSLLLGAVTGLGGFLIALATDLPTGATIVILSSAIVAAAACIAAVRKRQPGN